MKRVTLAQVFSAAAIAITIVVVASFVLFVERSRSSALQTAKRKQDVAAKRIEARVIRELSRAERVLEQIERAIASGVVSVDDSRSLEGALFTRIVDDSHLEEVTFTHAKRLGYDAKGEAELAPDGRWQLSVARTASGAVVTRSTRRDDGGSFTTQVRGRGKDNAFASVPLASSAKAPDPTEHFTFSVLATEALHGQATWSDLHWSELDFASPEPDRRVVVSVQKAVEDREGHFLGVIRVGIITDELDAIAKAQTSPADDEDVQRVALLATTATRGTPRLVARLDPTDRMVAADGEIRVASDHPPPEIRELLRSPIVNDLDRAHPDAAGSLVVDGVPWLATLREIDLGEGGTTGWMVAVLAPEARYTSELVAVERMLVGAFGITLALVLAIAGVTLSAVRRGLDRVTATTNRMRGFDFTPAKEVSTIRDIDDVMQGLERAKTVVRAMGKYVPLDLVKRLYVSNEEPKLGGVLLDISLMFTDIEGFTTLAEKLAPDVLATRLGDYLEAMTTAIESTNGTIDKYIGDAVMAIWNAPTTVPNHELEACRATLACMKATQKLYASSAWKGLPSLVTRFGLHEASVMVGNFGAPTRLSYTALGDGVNLAARLEPLCKQYGVVVLASEAIVAKAKHEYVFRRIDRVAVKGKTTGIDVFELLGAKDDDIPDLPRARRYEEAFEAYLARDFSRALAIFDAQRDDDPPSAVLADRCRELSADPPPAEWTGIHVARSK